ncbi:MAG: peroxiredoxin [Thermoplasmatota archaeon]
MLGLGDAAPDFVLHDADGQDVRLSSFSGQPIVLYFYPKDHTPGCTLEAKRFRDAYEDIAGHGGVVVGVSLDSSDSHCEFQQRHNLPFHLLSDPDGRVHDLYEAWRTTLLGKHALAVRRCTYLIDEDGIIRKVYGRINVVTHAKQVVQDLERLKAQRQWGKKGAKPKDLRP